MNLLKDFYQVLSIDSSSPSECVINLELNAKHPVYSGHFPGNPVLPGVCTLQIIKECAEAFWENPLQYTQIGSCKFLSAINPVTHPKLTLMFSLNQQEENNFRLIAEGMAEETPFIKLKATVTKQ
ncbi:hydroxymyristoyl-ACP dehydratase [Bacteroides sp. 224]|uniref:hydroxymyristoyl-ACP dehydratase n=1 Tax=Bacteroides sp. 224 TaxID=2302936 RepID=UPI0013D29F1D|nr:hydroxymyristoyl-ACP dehydratase [Bacteroides sp. 224]NDV67006.1 hydroxymyristoyl-ACP dehydratase [Bacteroides sp. 224]